ncbi:MAG TPA: hypothetical protein VHK67_02700, partial [Rhabdochlamydiaceae bacterium]|nr:hypothetical protein [Rhabdochlamydiaceae bacterium]
MTTPPQPSTQVTANLSQPVPSDSSPLLASIPTTTILASTVIGQPTSTNSVQLAGHLSDQIGNSDDCYDQLNKAEDLLTANNKPEEAREAAHKVLSTLTAEDRHVLAKAHCYSLIARTLPEGTDRNENATKAKNFALKAYEEIAELLHGNRAVEIYESFKRLF